jgi:hypothetical protein
MPRELRALVLLLVTVPAASGLGACSVDHRKLTFGGGAAVGAGGENASPDQPAAGAASGQSSGGSTTLPPLVDGCADLDTDGVADCKVTLVKNPSFSSDVTSWTAVGAATLLWDPRNALADSPSGCALLGLQGSSDADGSVLARATQCVATSGKQLFIAYANALVEASAGMRDPSRAELEVSFFDSDDCAGERTGYYDTPPSQSVGEWVTIQAGGVSAVRTRSLAVALAGLKPNRAEKLQICFDNILLKSEPLK